MVNYILGSVYSHVSLNMDNYILASLDYSGEIFCVIPYDAIECTFGRTIADGISRWDRASIPSALRNCRPDIAWQEQDLGQAGAGLCTGISASSTSGSQLRARLNALTAQASGLG